MKKYLTFGLLALGFACTVSCTPGEIGAGAIGVGVGIGIGRSTRPHHPRPYPPPRRRCDRYRCYDAKIDVRTPFTVADNSDLTDRYGISNGAASKIKMAFAGAQTQGLNSFQAVGLTQNDLMAFTRRQLPDDQAIARFAGALNLSQAQGRNVLVAMMREFAAQDADVNSEFWQYCMSRGHWKTPQNMYCTNTSWSGCSPQTGATFCY